MPPRRFLSDDFPPLRYSGGELVPPKEITAHPPRGPALPLKNGRFMFKPRVEQWVSCARETCPNRAVATVTAQSPALFAEIRPGALLVSLRVCESDVDWARSKMSMKSIVQEGKT